MGKHRIATDWLRLSAAARAAGRPRSSFDRAVRRGEIPFATIDGIRYFREGDVVQWAEVRDRGKAANESVAV